MIFNKHSTPSNTEPLKARGVAASVTYNNQQTSYYLVHKNTLEYNKIMIKITSIIG